MTNFLHRLLNPHCEHCALEDEKKFQRENYNPTIEYLKDEIERLRRHNDSLIAQLEARRNSESDSDSETDSELERKSASIPIPVSPRRTSWAVKQRELEAEDRNKARVLRKLSEAGIDVDKPMPLSDLDKEIQSVKESIANAG